MVLHHRGTATAAAAAAATAAAAKVSTSATCRRCAAFVAAEGGGGGVTTTRRITGGGSGTIPTIMDGGALRRLLQHHRRLPHRHRRRTLSSSSASSRGQQQRQQQHDRWESNARVASYAAAVAIGALGATYASVPLYKIFCQATGFGGTTQRVALEDYVEDMERREEDDEKQGKEVGGKGSARVSKISSNLMDRLYAMSNVPGLTRSSGGGAHKTWTDEEAAERLASLRPSESGRLIRVTFDSTIGDVLPWKFVPTQPSVRVVPGETALCFFSTTNTSDRAITGVATYNVYPPKAGLYFNKIQCFCFEEQRLLPGETVDMPVFFFLDPEYENDASLKRCNNITLSYTFFQTDVDDDNDDDDDKEEEEGTVAKGR